MKLFIFITIFLSPCFMWAQTYSTSSGGQRNTQANSSYVTPVVTKTYTAPTPKTPSTQYKAPSGSSNNYRLPSSNGSTNSSSSSSSSSPGSGTPVPKVATTYDDFYQLGINEMNFGSPVVAIGYFEKAISLNAMHAQSYLSIGKIKSKLEDYKAAESYFTKSLLVNANYDLALEGRADARMQLKEYAAAISDYDKAIAIAPHFLNYYRRAISKYNSKDYTGAVTDFTNSINTLDALQEDFDTEKRGGKPKPKKSKTGNEIKTYREVEDYPMYINSFYYRGLSKHQLSNYKAAIEDYDLAAAVKNNDPHCFYLRGNANLDMKQFKEAIQDYNRALQIKPEYAEAIKALAVAKSKSGPPAGTTFQSAYDRAIALQEDSKYTEAIVEFDHAIQLNGASSIAFTGRGYCNQELDLYAEAIKDYTKAIQIDSKSEAAWYDRGRCYISLGQLKEGIDDMLKVTALNPMREQAFNILGKNYLSLGDHKNAIIHFTNAIHLKPKSFTYCDRAKAKLSSAVKDYHGALADYSKAIEISPDHFVAYTLRAIAKREMKDFEGAIADLDKALQILPGYGPAVKNLKITKDLQAIHSTTK